MNRSEQHAEAARRAEGNTAYERSVAPFAAEIASWGKIQASEEPVSFRDYLARYPQGRFPALARSRLAQLQANARAPVDIG